jgi:hypothetical protein
LFADLRRRKTQYLSDLGHWNSGLLKTNAASRNISCVEYSEPGLDGIATLDRSIDLVKKELVATVYQEFGTACAPNSTTYTIEAGLLKHVGQQSRRYIGDALVMG